MRYGPKLKKHLVGQSLLKLIYPLRSSLLNFTSLRAPSRKDSSKLSTSPTCGLAQGNVMVSKEISYDGVEYIHVDEKNCLHMGTYTPLLQLLIQNVLTYFSLVF
jgi:hypothetical protein